MAKILVIEDEPHLLEGIMDILAIEDFETFGAPNGRLGIEMANQFGPDLIICDIMMPEVDGYGVLDELRRQPQTATIPFIFLTARTDRSDMRRGMELGADDYITKPFTQSELMGAVHARLDKKRVTDARVQALSDNFIWALPHELRTALAGIWGYARMLLDYAHSLTPDDIIQMSSGIDKAAQRMNHLFENYLLYAQIEIASAHVERVAALISQAMDNPEAHLSEIALQVATNFNRAKDLKMLNQNAPIQMGEEQFRKIVTELIDNAFKFSDEGTPIEIQAFTRADKYHLHIKDYGRGMTAEQLSQIGAYMQFERRLYEQQGIGLGLIIARRIVELHGGEFSIKSEYKTSTQVELSIPLHR